MASLTSLEPFRRYHCAASKFSWVSIMRPNAVLLESLLQQFSESINKFQGRVDPHQGVKLVGQICSMNNWTCTPALKTERKLNNIPRTWLCWPLSSLCWVAFVVWIRFKCKCWVQLLSVPTSMKPACKFTTQSPVQSSFPIHHKSSPQTR